MLLPRSFPALPQAPGLNRNSSVPSIRTDDAEVSAQNLNRVTHLRQNVVYYAYRRVETGCARRFVPSGCCESIHLGRRSSMIEETGGQRGGGAHREALDRN